MEKNKKHRMLIGIFGGVVVIIILAYGALWSLNTYHTANRYADDLTKTWKEQAKTKESLVKAESALKEAEKVKTTVASEPVEPTVQTAPAAPVPIAPTPATTVSAASAPAVPAAPATVTPTAPSTAQAATPAPVTPTPPVIPTVPVAMKEAKEVPEALKIAIVQKGEGIEHALIRQLVFVPELYGFKGDTDNKKVVKKWAQTKAHQIAILAGYVDSKTGSEVRVKGPGGNVAYVLQADSGLKLSVAQSCKDKDGNFPDPTNPNPELVKTLELAKDYQSATFQGNIDVRPYEYLFFGKGK